MENKNMDHDHYYDHHLDHLCLWSVPTSHKGLGQTAETSGIARVGSLPEQTPFLTHNQWYQSTLQHTTTFSK